MIGVEELAFGEVGPVSPGEPHRCVDLRSAAGLGPEALAAAAVAARASHRVLIGVGWPGHEASELLDALTVTVVGEGEWDWDRRVVSAPSAAVAAAELVAGIDAAPVAAVTLAGLLQMSERLSVHDGLVAESLAYSTLQAGPEYAAWLAAADYPVKPEAGPPIQVERRDAVLAIELTRPDRHNALSAGMRDALVEALHVAIADDSIGRLELTGRGRSFCSGGDLAEFGTAQDPARAHLVRTEHRPGEQLHLLAQRLGADCVAHVHGAVMGGGLEVAAFAGHIRARPDSRFLLPELSMGLVPGAGGTVSVPRRIGRWRTAWMVLTGQVLDADAALLWGLVDEVA
ncbi:enoyl-CoA hydratase/isomerase family protein [Tomitella biformata]|nr:enoyl-CoA hydratase/isomerase family protein [Tomitella biformata]